MFAALVGVHAAVVDGGSDYMCEPGTAFDAAAGDPDLSEGWLFCIDACITVSFVPKDDLDTSLVSKAGRLVGRCEPYAHGGPGGCTDYMTLGT